MKIAFISGINYPEFTEQGEIAFTLCDWIIKDKKYMKYYKNSTLYKITDNMAAENGISSPVDTVLQAARDVNSNEIWASDKLYDKDETIRLTTEFIKHLTKKDKKRFKIVGLAQGRTIQEWLECYKWMVDNPNINVIGISKYSVEAFASLAGTKNFAICRIKCIEYLHNNNLVLKPLHCAGASHLIVHEIQSYKKYPLVRGIDSNIAFKLGVYRIKIDECVEEPKGRLNHNIKNLDKEQLSIINYNINRIKMSLK